MSDRSRDWVVFGCDQVDALVQHARKFGVEGVEETFSGGAADLARLRTELAIVQGRPRGQRRPRSVTEAAVLELRDRGLVVSAIADALGLADKTVRNILAGTYARSETSKNGAANAVSMRPLFPRNAHYDETVAEVA